MHVAIQPDVGRLEPVARTVKFNTDHIMIIAVVLRIGPTACQTVGIAELLVAALDHDLAVCIQAPA